jgi:hypothetical protein
LPTSGLGTGITSEQSVMVFVFWPITAIFAIAALNDDCSFDWLAREQSLDG